MAKKSRTEVEYLLREIYGSNTSPKGRVEPFIDNKAICSGGIGLGDAVIVTAFAPHKIIYSPDRSFSTLLKYTGPDTLTYPSGVNLFDYMDYDWGGGHLIQRTARALGLSEIPKPRGIINHPKNSVKNRVAYHLERKGYPFGWHLEENPSRSRAKQRSLDVGLQLEEGDELGWYKENYQNTHLLPLNIIEEFYSFIENFPQYEFHNLATFTQRDDNSLDRMIEFLSTCDYFIGIDSGPMHLAAALDIKSIIIVGSHCHSGCPAPNLLYLPELAEGDTVTDIYWLYPQNVHLHLDGNNELVPMFSHDSLEASLKGDVYPYFKEDFLDITLKNDTFTSLLKLK